jgi:hypothetical protein
VKYVRVGKMLTSENKWDVNPGNFVKEAISGIKTFMVDICRR